MALPPEAALAVAVLRQAVVDSRSGGREADDARRFLSYQDAGLDLWCDAAGLSRDAVVDTARRTWDQGPRYRPRRR